MPDVEQGVLLPESETDLFDPEDGQIITFISEDGPVTGFRVEGFAAAKLQIESNARFAPHVGSVAPSQREAHPLGWCARCQQGVSKRGLDKGKPAERLSAQSYGSENPPDRRAAEKPNLDQEDAL